MLCVEYELTSEEFLKVKIGYKTLLLALLTRDIKYSMSESGDRVIYFMTIISKEQTKNETLQKTEMIFITQLVYIKEGQESVFHQFEDIAIPTIRKYNGRLLLQVRPTENAFIEQHIDRPYEIHLVEFNTEQDFENFKQDEERKKFLHLKDQSIKSVLLIKGTKL